MAIFDSGTKTIFHQTSAPTGWTKETVNYDNHALRVVNGSSLSSGGTVDFTTGFKVSPTYRFIVEVPYTVGGHTLTGAQLPYHLHPITPSTNRFAIGTGTIPTNATAPATIPAMTPSVPAGSAFGTPVGSSGAHNHPITITAIGDVFSPNPTIAVNYIDVIIASLN